MSTSGKRNGSSPPSTAKSSGASGEQLERVEVEARRGLLDPDDVRVLRDLDARRRR